MKNLSLTRWLLGSIFAAALLLSACSEAPKPVVAPSGEQIVNQLWDYMVKNDTMALDSFVAEGFQAVHENGAIDKKKEIELIKGLNIHTYTISDLVITQTTHTLLATYLVSTEETIDGNRLTKKPAARMSVFVEQDGKWLWFGHANLKPLEDTEVDSVAVNDTVK